MTLPSLTIIELELILQQNTEADCNVFIVLIETEFEHQSIFNQVDVNCKVVQISRSTRIGLSHTSRSVICIWCCFSPGYLKRIFLLYQFQRQSFIYSQRINWVERSLKLCLQSNKFIASEENSGKVHKSGLIITIMVDCIFLIL